MHSLTCNWCRSLRGRLLAAFAVGLLIVGAFISGMFMLLLEWPGDWSARHSLVQKTAEETVQQLEFDANGTPRKIVLQEEWKWLYDAFPRDVDFRVVNEQGAVVLNGHADQQLLPVFDHPPEVGTVDLDVDGLSLQLATVQLARRAGRPTYYLQAAASERMIALAHLSARNPVRYSLILVLLVSVPVLIGLMLLAMKNLLRPLQEASGAAARIDPRNLSARLPVTNVPTELVPLINAFNQALQGLERGFRVQQQFLAGC